MGQDSKIEWTDHTFSPWEGCQHVSSGCNNCYAEEQNKHWHPRSLINGKKVAENWGGASTPRLWRSESYWRQPRRWNQEAAKTGIRKRVFCSSVSDVFEDREDLVAPRKRVLELITECDSLDWLLLTKRPVNMVRLAEPIWGSKWPEHVWAGCTVEDQQRAEERIPHLLRVPTSLLFLSCEPLIEAVELDRARCDLCNGPADGETEDGLPWCSECEHECGFGSWLDSLNDRIGWVIVGSESGSKARPMSIEWARKIVDDCKENGVPVFVKQMITAEGRAGGDKKGGDPSFWPPGDWPREFPEVLS